MSSFSRRSRTSLAGDKQPSTNQRCRKRNAKDAAEEGNISFGSNVSIVFKGDKSLEGQEEDDQSSDQRAGKLSKLEHTLSVSEASENVTSSRPVRQAALKSRRSLTASIAATTRSRRRQSTRLSQNFKAELGTKAKSSMAEGLLSTSVASGSSIYSSEAPAAIGSVGNLFMVSSCDPEQVDGDSSHQNPLLYNQHLAHIPDQSKDRRLSLPAKCFSQLQQPVSQAHIQQLELQRQQLVQQCWQQQQLQQAGALALPYHRSSTSQPLDDVTAALLNKDHHSDISRLQQQQSHSSQQQKLLQQQQVVQLQHLQQLPQQQKKVSLHDHMQLPNGSFPICTSVAENSSHSSYQQQQPFIRNNTKGSCNGASSRSDRSDLESAVHQTTQSNVVFRDTPGCTSSVSSRAAFTTSNSSSFSSSSSASTLISQQNDVPIITVSRQSSILIPGVTLHPIRPNGLAENPHPNSLLPGPSGFQASSEQRLSIKGSQAKEISKNNDSIITPSCPTVCDKGSRQKTIQVLSRAPGSHSSVESESFNGAGPSGQQQYRQHARATLEHERRGSSSSSSSDDVIILDVPRSVTPEASAQNSSDLSFEASSSTSSGPSLYISCGIRPSPLPPLTWADRNLVWRQMCLKDRIYKRSPEALLRHPAVHQRMRAILLDWISEVCEVYTLHRETYYLAIDYIDRYLMVTQNVPKQQLQLLGITCLFIAAKVEEIYPPKISEFAYVTDGACRVEQITEKELIIVKTLSWHLSPLTINTWLNTYLQLLQEITRSGGSSTSTDGLTLKATEFVYQRFSGETFVQICRLLDLCILDTNSLEFAPSLLAASALSYFFGSHIACRVSSFTVQDLAPVQRWMKAFAMVVQSLAEKAPLKSFRQVAYEDSHNIQTKVVELDTLELAQKHQERLQMMEREKQEREELQAAALRMMESCDKAWNRGSPSDLNQVTPVSVLTPPKTDEKRDSEMESSELTSDHLIHSSTSSTSSGVSSSSSSSLGSQERSGATFSSNGLGTNTGIGSVVGHRPVAYNDSDAMEVS